MTEHRYRLPGGRARAASRREQVQAIARGAALFGPRYLSLLASARTSDRGRIHAAERSWAARASKAAELNIETLGMDRIDPSQQYVVAPLHEGFADVLALSTLPLDLAYSAAEELFDWRLLGRYLRASKQDPIPIDNGAAAYRAMLRSADAALERGRSYVVFPQGSILGVEIAFHGGAAGLAARSGKPLLPVVLTGGASVWEYPYSRNLNFGQTIRMEVLDPVDPTEVVVTFREVEEEMKDRALSSTPGPRRFDPDRDGWWDGYRYEIDPAFPALARRVADHRHATLTRDIR